MDLVFDSPPFLITADGDFPREPNAYLAWLTELRRRPDTIRNYAYELRTWLEWCEAERIDWRKIGLDETLRFRDGLGISNQAVNYAMDCLVRFYDFAQTLGLPSPIARYARPQNLLRLRVGGPVKEIKLVADEELMRFLRGFPSRRDRLLAEVMYFCGLRRGEALGITPELFNEPAKNGEVSFTVTGKGRKTRPVTISETLRGRLAAYAAQNPGGLIFNVDGHPMHRDTVEKAFAANRRRTGVKIHCHLLRHMYTTHRHACLKREMQAGPGMNAAIKAVQIELGHKHIETTGHYIHLANGAEASASLRRWQDRRMEALDAGE